MTVEIVVMVAGVLATGAAWRFVATGRAGLWGAIAPVLTALGAVALAVRPPVWSPEIDPAVAGAVGVAVGIALFLVTRAFVAAARRWTTFQRNAAEAYRPAEDMAFALVLTLSAIMVIGEELFWRGLFQARLAAETGSILAAVLTGLAYVAANLPSANLAIVAGALVGGAVWAGLASWSGGVLASLTCHLAWTALMLARPPRRRDLIA
jgi:CAAX protease family protein